jgi:hypothetical protein
MKFSILLGSAAIALIAVPVLACEGGGKREKMAEIRATAMQEADADGDGALTLAEFETFRTLFEQRKTEALFTFLDADGDGLVTTEEIANGHPRRHRERN